MAHRLVAVVMVSAAFLAATQPHAQEGQEEPIDVPGLYATVLAAVKEQKPNRRLVLDISRRARSTEPVRRLRESHVRALRGRTAVLDAVCDSEPEGRREQPCHAPGLREGGVFVNLGPVRMKPNGEVVVSVQLTTHEQQGVYEVRGITYVLRRQDDQWIVDRIADSWIM